MERAWKPNDDHHHIAPNCPRCGCSNTKFCYYNNYSLTQPRYFCKGCRRYWTKGGSLRNVPVGGGCRKNRRGFKSQRLSTTTTTEGGHVHQSKSTPNLDGYGGAHSNSYGTNVIINNSLGDSTTSSSVSQDGSRIDLALVYANFLNQKPENSNSTTGSGHHHHEFPELPSEFDPAALNFSSMALSMNNGGSSNNNSIHHELSGLVGSLGSCHTPSHEICSTNIDHIYFDGLGPLIQQDRSDHQVQLYATSTFHHDDGDFGLPPFPGQEALWSASSQMIAGGSHGGATPLLGGGGPEADDRNPLIGSWSPFDLLCNETFSRSA